MDTMFNRYRRILTENSDEADFWPSFTDLLSSILLVILIIMVFNFQSLAGSLKEKEQIIEKQQAVIGNVTKVREDIVNAIQVAFKDSDLQIRVDSKTGAISFAGSVLFDTGKDTILKKFKADLNKFVPIYVNILLSPQFRDHVAEIIVEGHTDDVGDYYSNLDLSQKRAYSVARYIISDSSPDYKLKKDLRTILSATGRSNNDLIKTNGKIDREQSRRVEIKFRLKDEQRIEELLKATEKVVQDKIDRK